MGGSVMRRGIFSILLAGFFLVVSTTSCKNPNLSGGILHFDQKRYERARETLLKAIAQEPSNAEAYFWLGKAYAELDSTAKAREILHEGRGSFRSEVPHDQEGRGERDGPLLEPSSQRRPPVREGRARRKGSGEAGGDEEELPARAEPVQESAGLQLEEGRDPPKHGSLLLQPGAGRLRPRRPRRRPSSSRRQETPRRRSSSSDSIAISETRPPPRAAWTDATRPSSSTARPRS